MVWRRGLRVLGGAIVLGVVVIWARLFPRLRNVDHFRDFRLGLVRAEGIDHNWLTLGHHEIFARFTFNREWEVSELSFAKAVAQLTRADSDIIALPVICSRLFRFSSFYVNKKARSGQPKT